MNKLFDLQYELFKISNLNVWKIDKFSEEELKNKIEYYKMKKEDKYKKR